ncbi:hypothetical protein FA15DRAFT_742646 [Coprinopsis marcescibilis]|uniref:Uncharacterized protein n=1 Tax=Coprinopsis marcescibilis TaxID=230819 RepID=A0A5C3K9C4_COPMA|nr:hypothetical protein FA15DRAFT_742646 [Coprinopsis marcescibilis]
MPHALDISKALEITGSRTSGSAMGPSTSTSDSVSAADEALSHLKLAAEWDSVLTTIRTTVPGFENFLMPPPCLSLFQNLPDTGPIIIINVHELRCDTLAYPINLFLLPKGGDFAHRFDRDVELVWNAVIVVVDLDSVCEGWFGAVWGRIKLAW